MIKKKIRCSWVCLGLCLSITACRSPLDFWTESSEVEAESDSTGSSEAPFELTSSAAKRAKVNAEILHEIFLVVFDQEPTDRSEFGNWADTLNQGASFEGVYNGLVHGANYRRQELLPSTVSPETYRVFLEELAELEAALPKPTTFESNFEGTSIFTLKRVLGEEALKVLALKGDTKAHLATWYSKWAVRLAQRNIDFGLPLRNKKDEAFHLKWALGSGEDQIKWEVLNRIHRLLNGIHRKK